MNKELTDSSTGTYSITQDEERIMEIYANMGKTQLVIPKNNTNSTQAKTPYTDSQKTTMPTNRGTAKPIMPCPGIPNNMGTTAPLMSYPESEDKCNKYIPEEVGKEDTKGSLRPNHYLGKDNPFEVRKVVDAWGLNFNCGNVIKYTVRAGMKDKSKWIEDLEKAKTYLDFEIERVKLYENG